MERVEMIRQHLCQYTTLRHETDMFNQSVSTASTPTTTLCRVIMSRAVALTENPVLSSRNSSCHLTLHQHVALTAINFIAYSIKQFLNKDYIVTLLLGCCCSACWLTLTHTVSTTLHGMEPSLIDIN